MKTIKKRVIIITFFVIGFYRLFAQTGGYAGSFLMNGIGVRAFGMGNAYVGFASDLTAGYWNPAGLARLYQPQFGFMVSALTFDRQLNYAAYVQPTPWKSTFGLIWIHYGVGDIENRDALGQYLGSFSDSENAFLLSAGFALHKNIFMGFTGKMLLHDLQNYRAFGFGFDLGLQGRLSEKFIIGASARNLLASITWNTENSTKEKLPLNYRIGLCYLPVTRCRVCLDLESVAPPEKTFHLFKDPALFIGSEFDIIKNIAIRLGCRKGEPTLGCSFKHWVKNIAFELNYGYSGDLMYNGAVQRIEAVISLGQPKDPMQKNEKSYNGRVIDIKSGFILVEIEKIPGLKVDKRVSIFKKARVKKQPVILYNHGRITRMNKNRVLIQLDNDTVLSKGDEITIVY